MIIKGYKGIMDLDLTGVNSCYHSSLIRQHKKDIENYKKQQEKLPTRLRYENTIGKVLKDRETYNEICRKKEEEKRKIQDEKYRHILIVNLASKTNILNM